MFRKVVFLIMLSLLIPTAASESAPEAKSLVANQNLEAWNRVIDNYSLETLESITSIPDGIIPVFAETPEQLEELILDLKSSLQATNPIVKLDNEPQYLDDTDGRYDEDLTTNIVAIFNTTKECVLNVTPSAQFKSYADVTIVVRARNRYRSINYSWTAFPGFTHGLEIVNLQTSNSLIDNRRTLYMRTNFTLNYYILTPVGMVPYWSNEFYQHCYLPA